MRHSPNEFASYVLSRSVFASIQNAQLFRAVSSSRRLDLRRLLAGQGPFRHGARFLPPGLVPAIHAAFAPETAIAEYRHYVSANSGSPPTLVEFSIRHWSRLIDLREPFADPSAEACRQECLDPNQRATAREVGRLLVEAGSVNGILYPSVRHAGGVCVALLIQPASSGWVETIYEDLMAGRR
jgi:RES domain-containing protein